MMNVRKKRLFATVTVIVAVAVVVCAVYIALSGLGLVEGYDFGIGAYYYADIPGFEKLINDRAFMTSVPVWVHVAIFLAWGWLMWKLWLFIDRR